jgi:hypothetical protein
VFVLVPGVSIFVYVHAMDGPRPSFPKLCSYSIIEREDIDEVRVGLWYNIYKGSHESRLMSN